MSLGNAHDVDQDVGGISRIDYRPVAWISPYA